MRANGTPCGSTTDSLAVDLARVEPVIERIVLAASADGGSFGQVEALYVRIMDMSNGSEIARFDSADATVETAFILGELYRRQGAWKFRAVGQGYSSGLEGLATDFGISVDEPQQPQQPQQSHQPLQSQQPQGATRVDLPSPPGLPPHARPPAAAPMAPPVPRAAPPVPPSPSPSGSPR